jgi:phage-related holin
MNWELFYKTGASVLGAIVGWLFGGWNPMLQVLFAFVVFDYISGLIASGTEGKLNSKIGIYRDFQKDHDIYACSGRPYD